MAKKKLPELPRKTMTTQDVVKYTFNLQNAIIDVRSKIQWLELYINQPKEIDDDTYAKIVNTAVNDGSKLWETSADKLFDNKASYEWIMYEVRKKKIPEVKKQIRALNKRLKEMQKDRDDRLDLCESDYPEIYEAIWQALAKLYEINWITHA